MAPGNQPIPAPQTMTVAEINQLQPKDLVIEAQVAEVAAAYRKAGIPDRFNTDLQAALSQAQIGKPSQKLVANAPVDYNSFINELCKTLLSWLAAYDATNQPKHWWGKLIKWLTGIGK